MAIHVVVNVVKNKIDREEMEKQCVILKSYNEVEGKKFGIYTTLLVEKVFSWVRGIMVFTVEILFL